MANEPTEAQLVAMIAYALGRFDSPDERPGPVWRYRVPHRDNPPGTMIVAVMNEVGIEWEFRVFVQRND